MREHTQHPLPIPQALPSFATPSVQLLPPNLYTAPIDSNYHNDDDMDCSPLSPMLLTDVDMDILTDTPPTPPPPWTQWNAEYPTVPPFHRDTFAPPPPVSIWQTLVPPSGAWHSPGFAPTTLHTAYGTANVSVPAQFPLNPNLLPYTYPLATGDPIQDTAEVHWEQLPNPAGTPQSTSMATLVDAFERSLTLVMPSSGAAAQSDPAQVIEDPPRTNDSGVPLAPLDTLRVNDLPDDSNPVQREATDTLGEELDKSLAYLLNLLDTPREQNNDRPPSPFEREATEPLEQDDDQRLASLLDLADPASLPTPRPPTPPPSRRPSKLTRHNFRLAPSTKMDHAELPVAQASVQAGKGAQLHPHQGAAWTPRPSPSRARVAGDEDDEEVGRSGSAWGVGRRTALGLVSRTPPTTRARKQKGEEARRVRTKRTRFVEDKGEKDGATSPAVRVRRTGSNDDSKRAGGPGPLRSILRNKHAMPYDKTMVRHAGRRRASVP